MSRTFPNPADQTATNHCGSKHFDIKINRVSSYVQPTAISPAPQMKHQGVFHRWCRRMIFKAEAFALVVALGTLPILPSRTSAYYFSNQSILDLSVQAQQARVDATEDVLPASPRQLPLTLVLETIAAVLLLVGLVSIFLANRAISPVKTATKDEKLVEGEADLASPNLSLMPLAAQNSLALNKAIPEQQEDETELIQLLAEISLRFRQAQSMEELLKTTVKEVRRALKSDRVVIFGFDNTNLDGTIIAESVAPGWPQILRVRIDDPCFRERHLEQYKNGQITTINDIYQEPRVTECYRKMLEQFAVKANLVAPILKNNQLLGLLIAHHCSEPRNWQEDEVDLFAKLANQVGFAIDQVSFLEKQEAEAERAQLITEITLRIRQSQYLEELLKTTVKEVRRALKTDRVLIFGLDQNNWDGIVVAESVAPGWPQTLRIRIDDPCLRNNHVEYKNGRVRAINNLYQEPGLRDCYIKMLEQFAVKAELVAPILKNNELLGLMIAHNCSEVRNWHQGEIDLFTQLATQVGFAVDQISLIERIE